MDSPLIRLKGQVANLATNAKGMGDALERLKTACGGTASEIQQAISGTSRQSDRAIIDTLHAAEAELGQAVAALRRAAHEANQFAASL